VVAVGKSGQLARPQGARVIDAGGDTLLPGLIDGHAHLVLPGEGPKGFRGALPVTGAQLLRSGVTTARIHLGDLVDGPPFARQAADDCFAAPRLQFGGPGFIGGAPDLAEAEVWGVKDKDDGRRKIEQVRSAGARGIALHDLERFAPGQLEDLVAEARRTGLRVMAQGDDPGSIRRALDVGVDSLEYFDRTAAPLYPDDVVARLKERGNSLFLVTPVGFYHRHVEFRRSPTVLEDPALVELMPAAVGQHLLAHLRDKRTKPDTEWGEKIQRSFATIPAKFRQLQSAGLQLVTGTDCGSAAGFHADSIWWELDTWRKLGIPPADAVRGATTRAAALLQATDVGRLDVGARADFVVLAGKLAEGRLDLRRVRYVAKGGVLFVEDGRWIGPTQGTSTILP
jgi:imidazolonepropionase-like amidohydrolase